MMASSCSGALCGGAFRRHRGVWIVLSLGVFWSVAPSWGRNRITEAASPRRSSISTPAQALAIPAYFPTTPQGNADWTTMTNAAPAAALAVANSNNGPDDGTHTTNPTWTSRITSAQTAEMVVLGYVYSSYTTRPLSTVEADIDNWYLWYPQLDGIFVDQVTTNAADAQAPGGYYSQLYAYIKGKGGKAIVVDNPGTQGPEEFMSVCDIYLNYENDNAAFPYSAFTPASWTAGYDASRFWHLVYNVTSTVDMQTVVGLSKSKNAGYLYVSDQSGSGNTWGTLPQTPGYWTSEVEQVQPLGRWRASNGLASLTYRFQFANTWDWKRVYIDSDRNSATGFQYADSSGTIIGADYLIENGFLYSYSGLGTDWNWTWKKTLPQTSGGSGTGFVNSVQWDLLQSDMGFTSATSLVFEVERAGGPRMNGFRYSHNYSSTSGPITDYFAENDSSRFYLQTTIAASLAFRQVFIDIDSNALTGYQSWGIGADYLVENGNLYKYAGTGTDWSWSYIGPSNLTQSGNTLTWWAWRASLAGPNREGLKFGGGAANLLFMGSGGHRAHITPVYAEAFSP